MAAPSPVLIESSPDEAYQVPSITPDSVRHSGNTASTTQSSPQLLSPSAFTRPRPQLLKSGSRAQQVPVGAHAGFASAATIWKVQGNEEQANCVAEDGVLKTGGTEHGERASKAKDAGKLTRPKRTSKPRKTSVDASKGSESPKMDSFIELKANAVAVPAQLSAPSLVDKEKPHAVATTSRRPSINISEYCVNADAAPKQSTVREDGAPAVKKTTVRKRTSKSDDKAKMPAPKKPRKPKARSEAIILDSDEPEPPLFDADSGVKEATGRSNETVGAKKPRSKAARKPDAISMKTGATKLESSKATKRCGDAPKTAVRESAEKSAYFGQPKPLTDLDRLASSPPPAPCQSKANVQSPEDVLVDTTAATLSTDTPPLPAELAPRRRRSWTPVKDSTAENTTNTLPIVDCELNERMGQTSFSEMLGSFNFMQSDTMPAHRAANGEASTKRRRVELSDVPQHAQSMDKSKAKAALKLPKAAKKPKAVPKKPQTITDRATEAYRPLKDADPEQSTISAHFTPRKEIDVVSVLGGDADGQEITTAKVKKPRKSRAKTQPLDDSAAVPTKSKPKTKTAKVKVKFDKKDHQAPLCSPTQALEQMKSQDFLFGTSSQLAAEESPDFVRDIQLAVQQSEMVLAMPGSSQIGTELDSDSYGEGKSYTSVPTAPHGTCLSIEQARKELWCVSARDETGSKLAQGPNESNHDVTQPVSEEHAAQIHDCITVSSSTNDGNQDKATTTAEQMSLPEAASTLHANGNSDLEDQNELLSTRSRDAESNQPTTIASNAETHGDDWMLLQSDDSVCLPQASICPPPPRPTNSAISPARRTALQALDANIPLTGPDPLSKTHLLSQVRPFSTTVPATERDRTRKQSLAIEINDDVQTRASPKRGRGRPRKEPLLEISAQTSPVRGRGRPRKEASLERSAQMSPVRDRGRPRKTSLIDESAKTSPVRTSLLHETRHSASPRRPVGRPRKVITPSDALLPSASRLTGSILEDSAVSTEPQQVFRKIRSPRLRESASQRVPRKEWTHIDEISDSDSPATPSPKRRRASSSPAFVRPLDFDIPQFATQPTMAKVNAAATAVIKPTDAVWLTMQAALFPQITKTITSAPSSGRDTNLTAPPSWHEKILLYDPIVLEDLTAWLNAQGVRTELERLKPKVKTRGRKKKDAPPEVDEWEVVRDELKPWMVQKWCEENSVCCLWREGLRGGVKGRY